jgi:hypothetical protein
MRKVLEARVGIEPTHKGFADLSLTTWVPRPCSIHQRSENIAEHEQLGKKILERETGFEPATSTLARSHSTTELLPLDFLILQHPRAPANLPPIGVRSGGVLWKPAPSCRMPSVM